MSRKKPIQPLPLDSFTIKANNGDDVLVEVRDETCLEIGRGLHKRHAYEKKRDVILERVAEDYFNFDRKKSITPKKDYLENASIFARELQLQGLGELEGIDDSSLRKKYYKDVEMRITALKNALESKRNLINTLPLHHGKTKPLRGLAAIAANKENPN